MTVSRFIPELVLRRAVDLVPHPTLVTPDAPIGLFDSGVGGLSVLRELVRVLPKERALCLADQAHVPYGGRPLPQIHDFATSLAEYLYANGAKIVVMACNISSAVALDDVRRVHGTDRVIGVVEPGAQAALEATKNGVIGVLATAGTVASGAYTRTIAARDPSARVIEVACPRFVPLVESDATETEEALEAAREYLAPLSHADTVVLGCTHYPFLLRALERVTEGRQTFVDPAAACVADLAALLHRTGLLRTGDREPPRLVTTGDLATFAAQAPRFFPAPAALEEVRWQTNEGAAQVSVA